MDIGFILYRTVFVLEGLALLCSLIYLKKYIKTPAKLIPVYLSFVFCIEVVALGLAFDQWMYNLLGLIELVIFAYIFYFTTKRGNSKKIILISFLISVILILVDALIITETFYTFLSNAFGFVSLGISIMCFVFLLELAKSDKVIYQNRILLYWVVLGLLIFHLCNLPVTVLTNDLFEIGNVENILIIQSIAVIAMYSCYIIGFIWGQKEYNY